jgi:DMSO/TMAO reductase YedYZ molybdopterin-dependent catalytic subunit
MKRRILAFGLLIGTLLTVPLTAIMYLANKLFSAPFAAFDLFAWVTRTLPGPVVTFGIDAMITTLDTLGLSVPDLAKTAEQTMAVIMFIVGGIVASALLYLILGSERFRANYLAGLIFGALFGTPIVIISLTITQSQFLPGLAVIWHYSLFLAWGLALAWAYHRLFAPASAAPAAALAGEGVAIERIDRRQFILTLGAASATVTVVGAGLATVLRPSEEANAPVAEGQPTPAGGESSPPLPNANDPVKPVPGTRPEYTPLQDHYSVFIQLEPSVINGDTWRLPITGLVENPLELTLDSLRQNYPVRQQYVTLNCISGRIPTQLIGTTLWTGVSVQDVLADAGVKPEAQYLYITSDDGYYETVDLDLINSDERIMFCYAWDDKPLPVEHGFPLRIWIPNRYGMKQPRWITGVEVTDQYQPGYWVERSWDKEAIIQTVSFIDTVAVDHIDERDGERFVPIGGIAWAGDRGISEVKVRVDGGDWQDAELRSPLSDTTWVIWRFEWPFETGEHEFEVRCAEADGTLQIAQPRPPHPSGARGIHSVSKRITA